MATTYSLSGRISGLSTNSTTLLSEMSYEAFGGLASEKYAAGNNLIHTMSDNSRLQRSEFTLPTDSHFSHQAMICLATTPATSVRRKSRPLKR